MLIVPISCDAPVYHWPVATVSLIAANVVIFFAMALELIDPAAGWHLDHGNGLHAQQWLLSIFTHANFGHLLGNMVGLWVFGLVTEGKLGWRRFLSCYFLIGVGQSAIEQLMFAWQDDYSYSLGASSAIYGLMAMSCVWAPKNNVTMFVWVFFFITTFDLSVGFLAGLYVGLDLVSAVLFNLFSVSFGAGINLAITEVLHLMGAAAGAAIGVVMLKKGKVDCETWDLFSVLSGNYGPYRKQTEATLSADERRELNESRTLDANRLFTALVASSQGLKALGVVRRMHDMGTPLELSRKEHLALIVALHKEQQWSESAPVMAEFIQSHPEGSDAIRLKLAQICIVELERPGKALEILDQIDAKKLKEPQQIMWKKLRIVGQRQVAEGVLEVDDGKF